jgi:hypothetical protein
VTIFGGDDTNGASAKVARGKANTFLDETGKFYALLADVVVRIPRPPFKLKEIARQTEGPSETP